MIIKDMNLINFGKFNHQSVSLKPGLNIIYGENEAGKTTLHTFIRAMLFGIERQRGKASVNDLYVKYEPWENPANYQGNMRIETDGVTYRIERNFNKEHRLFQVINEDTGKILTEDEIDQLFAGLDEKCYYNTISISQLGSSTDKELEGILKNYAANIGSTKSMEIDIKKAFADLDNQKKKINAEYKISEEDIIRKSIFNAQEQLEVSEAEQQGIVVEIEGKQSELKDVELREKELSAKDAKRLEELAKQNERKENLYQEVISLTADLEKNSATLVKVREHEEELKAQLQNRGIDSRQTMEKVNDKVMNSTNIPIAFLIMMMAAIGVGIGLLFGNSYRLYNPAVWFKPVICFVAAFFFLVLAIFKYVVNRRQKEEKLLVIKELRQTLERLEAAKHEEVYTERQVERKKENLESVQNMIRIEEQKEFGLEDYSEDLKELNEEKRKVQEAISKSQWVLEQKKERDIETEKRIDELKHREENIQKAKMEIQALQTAKEEIEEIANEIRNSFGRKLNEKASEYMGHITNGKYDQLSIDEKLNISVQGKNHLISSSRLSKGTVEQIYMSLRLAATDIIFETDKKPILLDDAFAMYDNKRMGNTLRYMSEQMEQVIVFSCHTREKLLADKLGLNYNFIRL